MRLSTVFELLVIALLIAFAASRVIDGPDRSKALSEPSQPQHRFTLRKDRQRQVPATPVDPPARYCSCSSLTCNCCRNFALPVVPIKGPGCATVSYVRDDVMMITMSFGDRVLRNITVNSKKPKPICMGMPGGISKFCGKLYSIKKEGENFKACLALELRALDDIEAALRVSCFKFGPNGVNVEPGEALPPEKNKEDEDEDDDDDDYGLGEFDDDDDDDDDFGITGGEEEEDDEQDERPPAKDNTYNDVDSSDSDADDDYTGFSALSEELFGGFFGGSNKRPGIIEDDDDDDDDDDEDDYIPEPVNLPEVQNPPKSQPQPLSQPQVNLVVMQPVIVPNHPIKPTRPAVQKRPVKKKPAKVVSTTPTSVKRVRPTSTPLKTTNAPIKTLGTSTTPSLPQTESTTPKAPSKKKKKPTRTRRPTTRKPSSTAATEATPTVITATTMTVNVVQGNVKLNETKPPKIHKPVKDTLLKIPMTKPVLDSKPIDSVIDTNKETTTNNLDKIPYVSVTQMPNVTVGEDTEKLSTAINEVTTQTIMQNTIPVDESMDDGFHLINSNRISNRKPVEPLNDNDAENISTTPNNVNLAEETTNQETTEHEVTFTDGKLEDSYKDAAQSGTEITEKYVEQNEMKDEETTVSDNTGSSPTLNSVTEPYYPAEEGTDKTEAITGSSNNQKEQENSSNEDSEDDEDDEDIDIGADLGLEDDDEDEEEGEESNESNVTVKKPKEKEEYDGSGVVDAILGNDEDDDKEDKEEERKISYDAPYQINPLLYRLARISTGSVATARHLPRYSEGRNRRNNKRMRFPSLEIPS